MTMVKVFPTGGEDGENGGDGANGGGGAGTGVKVTFSTFQLTLSCSSFWHCKIFVTICA